MLKHLMWLMAVSAILQGANAQTPFGTMIKKESLPPQQPVNEVHLPALPPINSEKHEAPPSLVPNDFFEKKEADAPIYIVGIAGNTALIEKNKVIGAYKKGDEIIVGKNIFTILKISLEGVMMQQYRTGSEKAKTLFFSYTGSPTKGSF